MQRLDFKGREQLYYQLYNILFRDITNGKYPVGSMIPAESQLMEDYHVSRATARKAVELLSNEGFVIKKQGHGTTVISHQPKNSPKRVVKYTKKHETDPAAAMKKVMEQKIIRAPAEIAQRLNLPPGEELVMLKRVRYAGTVPMYCEINYFERAYVPETVQRDFSRESLRVFLKNTCHIQWSYANQEIYAVTADEKTAALLQVPQGSPLIDIKRVSFDEHSVPREYVTTCYRGDKYHLEIELAI